MTCARGANEGTSLSAALRLLGGMLMAVALPLAPAGAVQFAAPQTLQDGISFITGAALGPEDPDPAARGDGCIYATSGTAGSVRRICFDSDKNVTSNATVVQLNGGAGTEFLIAVAFDPASDPTGEIVMYLSWEPPEAEPFNTRIARAVSSDGGASYSVDESFIRGLAKSTAHSTNGMAFGPDGCFYLAKGNNSNAGYSPDAAESRLAGAILRACFRNPDGSVKPGFDRDCGDGSVQEACDVEVYASGFRNPYDVAWHSNGRLYATDNDMDPEDSSGCGTVANDFGCPCQDPTLDPGSDELNLVEPGFYYGSPNPYLANPEALQCQGGTSAGFACADAGDCTGGGACLDLSALCTDPQCGDDVQCLYFGPGDAPAPGQDPNDRYRAPIAQPNGARMNGLAEFGRLAPIPPGGFCSDWSGDLLTGGSTTDGFVMRRFRPSSDGTGATFLGAAGLQGLEGLDVVVGPDGTIYGAEFGANWIRYIAPIEQPDPLLPDFFGFCAGPDPCDAQCATLAAVPALQPTLRLALALALASGLGLLLALRRRALTARR